jgi:hypothetical protein
MFDRVLFKKENTYLLMFVRDPNLAEEDDGVGLGRLGQMKRLGLSVRKLVSDDQRGQLRDEKQDVWGTCSGWDETLNSIAEHLGSSQRNHRKVS